MNEFWLRILSPEGECFAGKVRRLTARSSGGEFAVLAGHVPMAAVLRAGPVRILPVDGESSGQKEERQIRCGDGILFVWDGNVQILVEFVKNYR